MIAHCNLHGVQATLHWPYMLVVACDSQGLGQLTERGSGTTPNHRSHRDNPLDIVYHKCGGRSCGVKSRVSRCGFCNADNLVVSLDDYADTRPCKTRGVRICLPLDDQHPASGDATQINHEGEDTSGLQTIMPATSNHTQMNLEVQPRPAA